MRMPEQVLWSFLLKEKAMTLELPNPVAAYFAADRLDGDAVAKCFTDDAVALATRGRLTMAEPPSSNGRTTFLPNISTPVSRSLTIKRTDVSSSPAGSQGAFPAAQ